MTSWQNIAVLVTLSLVIMTNMIRAQEDQNEQEEIDDLLPKTFFNAISRIKNQIEHTESLTKSKLYGYYISNDFNFQHHIYKSLNEIVGFPMPNVSQSCLQQIEILFNGITHYQDWALKVIDSFGKPTSGILQGSLGWLGEYSECKNATDGNQWKGKYCIVSKPSPQESLTPTLALRLGVCVPNECSNKDIASLVNFATELLPSNFTHLLPFNFTKIDSSYITCDEPKKLSGIAVTAIVIFSLIVATSLIGTLYDLYKVAKEWYMSALNKHDLSGLINDSHNLSLQMNDIDRQVKKGNDSTIWRIFLSFSLYTNTIKLFTIHKSEDHFDFLHSLRFLSIAWVVLGHTYIFTLSYSDNPVILNTWIKRFSFTFVANAYFSVDNFFLFSGMLTSYLFLKETSKKPLNASLMIKYYLHRIWRITPTYGLVILFSYAITPYLGNGPLYPSIGFESPKCASNWWTNLLYINNFGNYSIESCLPVGWYLANDMQFHFIAPIILIPLALNKKKIAFGVTTLLMVTHLIATLIIIIKNPGFELGMDSTTSSIDVFTKFYVAPWCRIGPFLVGLILGYVLYTQKKKNYELSLLQNLTGWFTSIVLLLFTLFIIYPNLSGNILPKWFNIIYQTVSRTIWGVGLAYIIFACASSNGGFVNKLLSLPIWVPLSRLSFSIYLIHTTIILYYNSTLEHMFHLQDSTVIYAYVSHLTFATCAAYLVSMFFEVPIIGLEKFIFSRH